MTPYYDRDGITIYHGDCLDILPYLGDADHVITDPPYARDVYMRMSAPNTKAGSDTPNRLGAWGSAEMGNGPRLAKLAAGEIGAIDDLLAPVSKAFGWLTKRWTLVFCDVESVHLWRAGLEDAGLRYIRTGAWVKPDAMPQMSGDRPAVGFEACVIAHTSDAMRWNGGGHPAVWSFNTAKGAERPDHPCPKPLPLMRALIEQFTDRGDVILDPFAGSGTTGRAAMDLGRKAILIEKEERWCETAAQRMAQGVLL